MSHKRRPKSKRPSAVDERHIHRTENSEALEESIGTSRFAVHCWGWAVEHWLSSLMLCEMDGCRASLATC